MKYYLEEESEIEGEMVISKIKTVKNKDEAQKDKTSKKCFLHKCYHDEKNPRPCKREAL